MTVLVLGRLGLIYAVEILSVSAILLSVGMPVDDILSEPTHFLPVTTFFLKEGRCIFILE